MQNTDLINYVGIVLVSLVLLCWLVVSFLNKKFMRRYELERHIKAILDQNGCDRALELCEQCAHISTHYGIPLKEAGFNKGLAGLDEEAHASLARSDRRKEATVRKAQVQ